MTTHRQIRFLGSFQVTVDGEAVTQFGSDTARALLAYLALHPGVPLRRESLAGLLWPEHTDAEARRNLRVALSRLRAATKDRDADAPLLHVERQAILFAEDARDAVDIGEMRAALAETRAHAHQQLERCSECADRLRQAVDLYRGEFLAGFSLDSVPFEEWLVVERESLHWQALEALSSLAAYHEREGNYETAIERARRQIELEPWREVAHRQCMRALAASGHRGAALAQYETCRQVLAEELGVEPEPETQTLYDRIRSGALAPPALAPAVPAPPPAPAEPKAQAKPLAPVAPPIQATYPPASALAQPEGERRTVTVLSIGFMALGAAAQDPELWAEAVAQALGQATGAVGRYGGEVSQLREDGLVALFGAVSAHEDDPERAVLSALELVQAAQGGGELQVQAGVHTGEAIVPRIGSDALAASPPMVTALGNVVPVADQIGCAAELGTVLASEATYRLARPFFEWEACGEIAAGRTATDRTALRVYRPLRRTGQMDALLGKGRGVPGLESPLVGRDAEVEALRQALEDLQKGVGGIVTVVGDAGIGKSRLVAEIRTLALSADGISPNPKIENLTWLEGRCLSYTTTEAYRLWVDVLRALLCVSLEASATAVRDTLREHVHALCGEGAGDVYPFVARLMSLPLEEVDEARLHGLDAMSLRALTFRAWETLLECAASQYAITLVCEDLHWADPTSLALLEHLLPLAERVPLLLICVFRPITDHGCWQVRELAAREFRHRHTDLFLEALTRQQSGELVGHLLHIEDLPSALRARILEHAEGNPFYVEEILRSLIDGGTLVYDKQTGHWQAAGEPTDLPLPDTLRGVLTARIDRLPLAARHVLQLASIVGRIFERRVLESLAPSTSELDEVLRALRRAQMIRTQAQLPAASYIFKHQLTLEAAYESLLRRKRRALHRRVAEALERLYPEQVEELSGLLAHHWERAGDVERAVRYLWRAGDQAAAHFANSEAVAYYTRALYLTPVEDAKGRYALLLAREEVHNVQGERAEQGQDLAALEELSALLGEQQQAEVAVRRAHHAIMIGDYARAIAAAQVAARLGEATSDVSSQAAGHRQWGRALRRQMRLEEAQVQYERALALARGAQLRREQAYCMRQLGLICFARGDNTTAAAYHEQSLQIFFQIGDRRGEGMSLRDLAWALAPQGKMDRALRCLEQSLHICRETGDRRDEGWAIFSLGHYHWMTGDLPKAADAYARSLPFMHGTDPMGEGSAFLHIGLVYMKLGDCCRAQEALKRSLHIRRESASDNVEAAVVLAVLALLSHYSGDGEKALAYCRQVQHITQDPAKHLPEALILLGRTLSCLGHLAEAADAYSQASEMLQDGMSASSQVVDRTAELYAAQAHLYLDQEDRASALVCVEKIMHWLQAQSTMVHAIEPFQAYLSCYRVLRAHADPRAGPLLNTAYDLLQERANKISDPALRRSFLEKVHANREIAILYAQQSLSTG